MKTIYDLFLFREVAWWGLLLFAVLAICTLVVIKNSWKTDNPRKMVQMFECARVAHWTSIFMFILIGTINITRDPYEIVFWLTVTFLFSVPNLVFLLRKKEEYRHAKRTLLLQEKNPHIIDLPHQNKT